MNNNGMLVPVPEDLPSLTARLAEPLACALYGHELARISHTFPAVTRRCEICGLAETAGARVLVFGAGPMGMLLSILAQTQGARRVVMVHNSSRRARWIVERGIAEADSMVRFGPEAEHEVAT